MKNARTHFGELTEFKSEDYIQQMKHLIRVLHSFTKASECVNNTLHDHVNGLQTLKSAINSLRSRLSWTFISHKIKSFSSLTAKTDLILSELSDCEFQIGLALLAINSKIGTWLTHPLSFYLSTLTKLWSKVVNNHPSFNVLQFRDIPFEFKTFENSLDNHAMDRHYVGHGIRQVIETSIIYITMR